MHLGWTTSSIVQSIVQCKSGWRMLCLVNDTNCFHDQCQPFLTCMQCSQILCLRAKHHCATGLRSVGAQQVHIRYDWHVEPLHFKGWSPMTSLTYVMHSLLSMWSLVPLCQYKCSGLWSCASTKAYSPAPKSPVFEFLLDFCARRSQCLVRASQVSDSTIAQIFTAAQFAISPHTWFFHRKLETFLAAIACQPPQAFLQSHIKSQEHICMYNLLSLTNKSTILLLRVALSYRIGAPHTKALYNKLYANKCLQPCPKTTHLWHPSVRTMQGLP